MASAVDFYGSEDGSLVFGDVSQLSTEQRKRYDRIFQEPLYLIAANHSHEYLMHGSTGKQYCVRVNPNAARHDVLAKCDCPDARQRARQRQVLCKHACYVLIRVLKLSIRSLYTRPDAARVLLAITEHAHHFPGQYTDEEFSSLPPPPNPYAATSQKRNDECPVCCEDLTNDEKQLQCPECRNALHEDCMRRWVRGGSQRRERCVFCRTQWPKLSEFLFSDE